MTSYCEKEILIVWIKNCGCTPNKFKKKNRIGLWKRLMVMLFHTKQEATMNCIKTGAVAFIGCYGEWIYGDVMQTPSGDYIMRVCQRSREPISKTMHFTFHNFDEWYDKNKTSQEQNSTMVIGRHDCINHGYDGVPV